jgi:8-oxo-dGTP pyrophosphatase MutT (NUDIX family)
MTKRHTNIVSCFLILEKNNKVLLLKRANTGFYDGQYSLVAGHVDPGETFTQAMIREAKEEAGLDLKPDNLETVHVMHRKSLVDQSERVDVYFKAKRWQPQPRNCEPDKCSELKWFNLDNLPQETVPFVRKILTELRGEEYSEWGWDQ